MPKIYSDKEIRTLRREKRVTDENGQRLKPALLRKKSKKTLTSEERQARAIEQIPIEIEKVLKSNASYATIFLEMIRKIRVEPIRIPEWPEKITKWKHTPSRGADGKTKYIISEVI